MSPTSNCKEKKMIKDFNNSLKTLQFDTYKWITWILMFLLMSSFGLFILFWCTNFFNDIIISNLQLKNGTLSFAWWQNPSVQAVYRIRIFNYTNIDDFENGKVQKLHVQEVGPYIYRETLNRVNPEIDQDGTVTYQEMRSYQWEGGHSEHEIVTVPNIPLFTAMAFSRDMSFLAQVSLTALLSTIQAKPFINVPAGKFLWGYDDELFRIAKPVMVWQQNIPYDKFGILAFKAGLSKDRITIKSGINDLQYLGNIIRVNGKNNRNIWHNETCDKIEGSDGSMFSPKSIQNTKNNIKVYAKEMCRSISLRYSNKSQAKGIPILRYTLTDDSFISNSTLNSCFCQQNINKYGNATFTCTPKGLFNNSACNYGAPMLSSFPHFYQADKESFKIIEGLNPKKELHSTYIDLHPRLGVPIGGWSRVQLNLEARKADAVPFMGRIKDGAILPILWIEVGIDKIPKSVMNILYHAYYTLDAIEACLQYGSLFGFFLIATLLLFIFMKHKSKNRTVAYNNIIGQDQSI